MNNSTVDNFVNTLNDLLIENELSQSEFSEKIGTTPATVSRYLSEKQFPEVELSIKIADRFNCSLDFLFGRSDENKPKSFCKCPPFAERFLFLLQYFKINQSKLRKKTAISKSAMYYWSSGKRKPTMESIIKLANYFNCSIDFILGRVNFD